MGLSMCFIPEKSSRLSFLGELEYSASGDLGSGKIPFEEPRDFAGVYTMNTQCAKNSLQVPVKKGRKLKSSISLRSGTSPRVLFKRLTNMTIRDKFLSDAISFRSGTSPRIDFERITNRTIRDKSDDSSTIGVGGGLFWSYSWSITDSYCILPMTKVHSNLFIGNQENSNDEDMLISKGITHILSLIGHQSSVGKVERKQYPMHDKGHSDIKKVLAEVYEFMESGQRGSNNLLVHCKLGQNRSAVVVIAFLMKKFKKTLHRAYRDLKQVRPLVQVNVDYAKQLLDLEREYLGKNSLPPDWMETEYNEAENDFVYKHEDLSTLRQRELFANIDD